MELDEILAMEVATMSKDRVKVGEALTDLTNEQYAAIDDLVFQALQAEPTRWDSDQLAAIGRAMCEAVIGHFERSAVGHPHPRMRGFK